MSSEGDLASIWQKHREELGLSLAFAFLTSTFVIWADGLMGDRRKAALIYFSGQIAGCCFVAITMGYYQWPWILAVPVGAVSGVIGYPALMMVKRGAKRGEERAPDIADKGISILLGKEKKHDHP